MNTIASKTSKTLAASILLISTMLGSQATYALGTDRNEPVDISADDVEIDLNTGERIFIGDVRIIQGSLKLKADKLVANYTDGKLQNAIAFGSPARFSQRPDGANIDDQVEGREIRFNAIADSIDLIKRAKVLKGGNVFTGDRLFYNRATGKLKGSKVDTPNSRTKTDPFFNSKPRSSAPKPAAPSPAQSPKPITSEPTQQDISDLPLLGETGKEVYESNASSTPSAEQAAAEALYENPPVIDRGETLPQDLVLPKKTGSSSNRSRLIILPK